MIMETTQLQQRALVLVRQLGESMGEDQLTPKVAAMLSTEFEISDTTAYSATYEAISELIKPAGVAVDVDRTNESCVWVRHHGQPVAIPVAALDTLIIERLAAA